MSEQHPEKAQILGEACFGVCENSEQARGRAAPDVCACEGGSPPRAALKHAADAPPEFHGFPKVPSGTGSGRREACWRVTGRVMTRV